MLSVMILPVTNELGGFMSQLSFGPFASGAFEKSECPDTTAARTTPFAGFARRAISTEFLLLFSEVVHIQVMDNPPAMKATITSQGPKSQEANRLL
jgi:hypothetical protein